MRKKILLIGASTGGPSLIKELLCSIDSLNSTIIVVQHMREEVLPFYIKDLQESLKISLYTTPLRTSFTEPSVIVCKESSVLQSVGNSYEIVADKHEQKYTPDINKLLSSFAPYTDRLEISVLIMTGIGDDGVLGAQVLKQKGAKIYAQDEESSPVYGMPKAVLESGIVDKVKSFDAIKAYIRGL